MTNTASLTKAAPPTAKIRPPKVVKLGKSGSAKPGFLPKLSTVKAKKTGGAVSSGRTVEAKSKPVLKTDSKKGSKPAKTKSAPKQAAAKALAPKPRNRASAPSTASAGRASPTARLMRDAISVKAHPEDRISSPIRLDSKVMQRHLRRQVEEPRLGLNDVKIFQIYYAPEQMDQLDPDFTPYDNQGNSSRLFEFSVFTKLAQSNEVADAKLWGAMSWKFASKTGISGRQFKEEIVANPGYDAYYCNPYPENEALFHNMWLQGELAHPNFMPLCAEIFEVAGLPQDMLSAIQPSSEFSAANYFVANKVFWRAYIGFVSRVLISADKKLSPTAKRIFYSSTADKFGAHAEASYIPFLVERLFAVFLRTEGEKFKTYKLAMAAREKKDNVHLKLLTEMKDIACRTKSMWLAVCWINYRNLYLSKIYGENWAKTHLKQITPTNISFMAQTVKPEGKDKP